TQPHDLLPIGAFHDGEIDQLLALKHAISPANHSHVDNRKVQINVPPRGMLASVRSPTYRRAGFTRTRSLLGTFSRTHATDVATRPFLPWAHRLVTLIRRSTITLSPCDSLNEGLL
ncbi:MAG: hypothetical protein ACTS5I_13605, partial [Rhodanobacter sp.]